MGTRRADHDVPAEGSGPRRAGAATPFAFDNPDFNFKSLRVNAVFRRDASALVRAPTNGIFL